MKYRVLREMPFAEEGRIISKIGKIWDVPSFRYDEWEMEKMVADGWLEPIPEKQSLAELAIKLTDCPGDSDSMIYWKKKAKIAYSHIIQEVLEAFDTAIVNGGGPSNVLSKLGIEYVRRAIEGVGRE